MVIDGYALRGVCDIPTIYEELRKRSTLCLRKSITKF